MRKVEEKSLTQVASEYVFWSTAAKASKYLVYVLPAAAFFIVNLL